MKNLIDFLIKHNYWFLFFLLEATSFALLFRYNAYQQSVFFTSANVVVGKIYESIGKANAYFNLYSENDALLSKNIELVQKVTTLEKQLNDILADSAKMISLEHIDSVGLKSIKAHVIKNSINLANNYITLDKGANDGVQDEMGVIDAKGVVGIVYKTSAHYSLVISLLNSKSSISCKIVGSGYFGYLKWEKGDPRYAYLKDLPRHAEFNIGDTVITSGFSTVFPEGIVVGKVEDKQDSNDGLSYLLKVRLATDFGNVGSVRVINKLGVEEERSLEEEVRKETEEKTK